MGAAVAIDICKPKDASDIRETGDLDLAKSEVIRLRGLLGHLAMQYGMKSVVLDASDLVFGDNDDEDFDRCVKDIAHIRCCLHLHTQTSIRNDRKYTRPVLQPEDMEGSDEDSGSSEDEGKSTKSSNKSKK